MTIVIARAGLTAEGVPFDVFVQTLLWILTTIMYGWVPVKNRTYKRALRARIRFFDASFRLELTEELSMGIFVVAYLSLTLYSSCYICRRFQNFALCASVCDKHPNIVDDKLHQLLR